MSTALAKPNAGFAISKYDMPFEKFIEMAVKSGSYPDIQTAQQAVMKCVYGHALGLDPATSLTSINLIKGKPTMSANLMAARVNQSGRYYFEVIKKTETECHLQFWKLLDDWTSEGKAFKRWIKPGPPEVFTMKMAERAGLSKNDNYKKWPEAMLYSRCVSSGVKTYCPEVMSGLTVYTPDELDANVKYEMVGEELVPVSDVVQTTATVLEPAKMQRAAEDQSLKNLIQLAADTKTNLKDLLKEQFGVTETQQLTQPQLDQATQVLKLKASGQKLGAVAAK